MAATYSSSSSTDRISTVQPDCEHGGAVLLYCTTVENPGRRYWRCPRMQRGCGCFLWYERPYEGQVKKALVHLAGKFQEAEGKVIALKRVNGILVAKINSTREEMEAKLAGAAEEVADAEDCAEAARVELQVTIKEKNSDRLRLEGMVAAVRGELELNLAVARKERDEAEEKFEAKKKELQVCLCEAEQERRKVEAEFHAATMKNEQLAKALKRSKMYTRGWMAMGMVLLFAKVLTHFGQYGGSSTEMLMLK